jgi:hypothetical protein
LNNQHRINLLWEITQALIALVVVCASVFLWVTTGLTSAQMSAAFFLIVGFYFGRTNHTRPNGDTKS